MPIERDLHELLYAHDCVIVPRFGGFLTHYRSARLDEQRRSIHPPSKDVSFNRHLVRTDGLLTDHLAKREGFDFNQANAVIDGEVDAWQSKLNRNGRLELPRIGTFYRDAEKNLQFDPDKRANFLKDAYGLRAVPAVSLAVHQVAKEVKVIPLVKPEPVHDQERTSRRIPALLTAAALAAVCFTAGTWWVVSRNSPDGAQWSGFDLFAPDEPTVFVPRAADPMAAVPMIDTAAWTIPSELTGVNQLAVPGSNGTTLIVDLGDTARLANDLQNVQGGHVEPAKAVSTAVVTPNMRTRFHIIGGCFLVKENADAYVANLQAKGFAASIIDQKGGLYRVAYGSYPQRALALEALSAVRKEEAPEAWLLVR